ncbi:hypothetical protein [Kribbella sp. NPDC023855]|uniref:hypothetical protein n=1 Tax=Kribbella sp. NPDC023855 TaxID=3154698 RepID=UPI0033D293BA
MNGTTAKADVVAGGLLANVTWAIERAEDPSKNSIVCKYGKRTHPALSEVEIERWVHWIEYGGAGKIDRRVEFDYEGRPDKRFGFAYGQERESLRRLKTVLAKTFVGATGSWQQARSYTLSYENTGATNRSRLAGLKECGMDDQGCKRPTVFKWTNGGEGFAAGATQVPLTGSVVPSSRDSQVITADLNGDGRTDLAWPEADRWKYVFAEEPGSSSVMFKKAVDADVNGYGVTATAYPIDYDLNGGVDLLPREVQNVLWRPVLTLADGPVKRVKTNSASAFNQVLNGAGAMTGDFDGDGYQDVLEYRLGPDGTNYKWAWRRRSGTVNPLIDSANPYDDKAFGPQMPVSLGDKPKDVLVVDLDGDGRDEVVTPLGWHDLATGIWNAAGGPGDEPFKLNMKFVDLNGDGLLDLVADGQYGVKKPSLYYKLNRGNGTFTLDAPMNIASGGFAGAELVDGDGDGDGRQELLIPRLSAAPSTSEPLFDGLDVVAAGVGTDGSMTFTKKTTTINFKPQSLTSLKKQGTRVVDADGDGQEDVLLVDRPEPGASGPVDLRVFRHLGDISSAGNRPDMLHRIYEGNQAPKGSLEDLPPTVTFKYAPLTDGTVYELGQCPRQQGRPTADVLKRLRCVCAAG